MMRPVFALLLFAGISSAQPFLWGFRAGVPLSDAFNAVTTQNFNINTDTGRYLIGPTAELHLPFGFGVEVDALYRHFSYTATNLAAATTALSHVNSGDWEFPVLAKYRFPARIVRPYINGGVAWNKLSGVTETASSFLLGSPSAVRHDSTTGVVFGGGVDLHVAFVHIMPEIRYIHWTSPQLVDPTGVVRSSQNQGEFLLGILF